MQVIYTIVSRTNQHAWCGVVPEGAERVRGVRGVVRYRRGRSVCGECVVCCGSRGGGASAVSAWCGVAVPEGAERMR